MAFTLVTDQTIIARNAAALYGVAVGNADMTSFVTLAGTNPDALLNQVYTASVGSASVLSVAQTLVANLGITAAADVTVAQNYIIAQLNPVAVAARGAAINNILSFFSNLTDATWGPYATAWNAQVANDIAYAAVPGNTIIPISNVPNNSFTLTTGIDNIIAGAGNDIINAPIINNSNTLQSGDNINGGGGVNTLNADIGSSANFAITPNITNVQKVSIRAEATHFDTANGNNTQGNVTIDAQRAASVNTWESSNSRSDVIIEDVRTNSNVTTVAFVESDPGNVDLGVYFNERNLVNTVSGTSILNILVMDTAAAAAPATSATPLLNNYFNSFTFFANNAKVVLGGAGTAAGAAIDASTTYAQLLAAFQLALKTASVAGVITDLSSSVTASLSAVQNMTTAAGSSAVAASFLNLNGQVLSLTVPTTVTITASSSTGEAGGWAASGPAPTTGAIAQTINTGNSSAAALVSTNIILDDVGMGDIGGNLVVGGMSTGLTSNDLGVQQFNIEVRDNSNLQTINSTNNTLREVYITNGVTTSTSTAYVTTTPNAGTLTVNGGVNPNGGSNGILPGTTAITGTNQTFNHSGAGAAGFTDVRVIDASAMTGKFAFTAAITSDSIAKYINAVDTQANPAADVATAQLAGLGANFIYTGGSNNDTMAVTIDAAVASSRSTLVSGQSDFTFNINGGAGDDNITVSLNNLAGGAQAWYTNQKLNANITINGGDGNDTINKPGAGDAIINGGAGNDTIYADNTGALNASPYATGYAGTAAVAYANAAAAELSAGLAAAVASNTTGFVHNNGVAIGVSLTAAQVVNGLAVLDHITPTNAPALPVITHAALAAGTAAAAAAGVISLAQEIALDAAYNSSTGGVVTPGALGAAATITGAVAVAGAETAGELAAGDALLASYVAAANAALANATAADALVANGSAYNATLAAPIPGELLNATQQAVVVATQAVNGVDDPTTVANEAGTSTIVAGLSALSSAITVGATAVNVTAALDAATLNGSITAAQALAINGAIGAYPVAVAGLAAATAILSPLQNTANINNAAAQATLTAAIAADVLVVNAAATAAAANPVAGNGVIVGAVDSIGSTEAANAAAAASAASAAAAKDLSDAQAVVNALTGLKAAVNVGGLLADVTNAIDNATAAINTAIADDVANGTGVLLGTNPLTVAEKAALVGLAAAPVTAASELAFDTGALGVYNAASVDSQVINYQALVDNLAVVAANAAAIKTATATASTIALAAANSGGNSLILAAPKAVYVFDTSNQSASYNRLTMDDRNLADLKSDVNNAYNFFNSTVHVTYKGIDASFVVAGGTDFKTTDLQINQAIKLAINNDAVLSKLLLATDGPANTLVVTSLIDGTHTTADLSVSLTAPTTAGSNVAAAAASYGLPVGSTDAAVVAAINTATAAFSAKGDYTTQFAESGAANGNVTLTGANSTSSSDNTITGGTGDDVIVLGTTVGTDLLTSSNDKVVFGLDFGHDTVVNFAATGFGIDQLDFSALHGRGNVALGSLTLDNSIVIGAPTSAPLTAVQIATLFTDSATAINHVYVQVDATNIGSVYAVADAAGTAPGNVVATLVGTIDLASTAWGTLTAANFA